MFLRNCVRLGAVLSFLLPCAVFAQDERRVFSPDHQVEFRIFVAPQEPLAITRAAYQVWYHGRAVVQTSFMAVDIWSQEPRLGEQTGLISSSPRSGPGCNSLTVNFMQNGSLGRLLTVEVRVYNDGVAFRYHIPYSTPLRELQIADEATEFALPKLVDPPPALPLVAEEPGPAWLKITEIPRAGFPQMHLAHFEDNILVTRLARKSSNDYTVYEGTTPITLPWRVIAISLTREGLADPAILRELRSVK